MSGYRLWISTIGDTFEPGVWDRLQQAAQFCVQQGGQVTIGTIDNKCVTPFHGLAMMRNIALLDALENQATHLLMMDTDILIEEESTLHRWVLSQQAQGTTCPEILQTRLREHWTLAEPEREGPDPQELEWAVMSCCLFEVDLLAQIPLPFFQDFMAIAEEQYYWRPLRRWGIRCIQDPSIQVTLLRPPTPIWDIPSRVMIHTRRNGRQVDFDVRYLDDLRP